MPDPTPIPEDERTRLADALAVYENDPLAGTVHLAAAARALLASPAPENPNGLYFEEHEAESLFDLLASTLGAREIDGDGTNESLFTDHLGEVARLAAMVAPSGLRALAYPDDAPTPEAAVPPAPTEEREDPAVLVALIDSALEPWDRTDREADLLRRCRAALSAAALPAPGEAGGGVMAEALRREGERNDTIEPRRNHTCEVEAFGEHQSCRACDRQPRCPECLHPWSDHAPLAKGAAHRCLASDGRINLLADPIHVCRCLRSASPESLTAEQRYHPPAALSSAPGEREAGEGERYEVVPGAYIYDGDPKAVGYKGGPDRSLTDRQEPLFRRIPAPEAPEGGAS